MSRPGSGSRFSRRPPRISSMQPRFGILLFGLALFFGTGAASLANSPAGSPELTHLIRSGWMPSEPSEGADLTAGELASFLATLRFPEARQGNCGSATDPGGLSRMGRILCIGFRERYLQEFPDPPRRPLSRAATIERIQAALPEVAKDPLSGVHRLVQALAASPQGPLKALPRLEFAQETFAAFGLRLPEPVQVKTPTPPPSHQLRLPILMFHHIQKLPPDHPHRMEYRLSISPQKLDEILSLAHERGYTSITFADLLAYQEGRAKLPPRPVMFTFDDGYADNFHDAKPRLEKYGFRGVFAVATGTIGGRVHMTWEEVRQLARDGHEVVSHSHSHRNLKELGSEDLERELRMSKSILENELEAPVDALVYPYGAFNNEVVRIAKGLGYKLARSTRLSTRVDLSARYDLPTLRVLPTTSRAQWGRWFPNQDLIVVQPRAKEPEVGLASAALAGGGW